MFVCESEWTPGVGDGQGGLACCDSWGRKESDTTEQLNWTELLLPVNLGSHIFMLFSPKVGIYFYFPNYLLKILLIYREDATIISLYPVYIDPPIVTILPRLLFLFLSASHSHSST